jgi:hypothetical protein
MIGPVLCMYHELGADCLQAYMREISNPEESVIIGTSHAAVNLLVA